MTPRDIALFLQSAETDAQIATARRSVGARAAFEQAYTQQQDPWSSDNARYSYQRWKYESLMSSLPPGRRFGRALDLGCGMGAMSLALTRVSCDVLGLDIAEAAVEQARGRNGTQPGLRFAQGDLLSLDKALQQQFDLVVVADTLYYLDRTDDAGLKAAASLVGGLLAPGGLCLLANHYFFSRDKDSKLTRRIHDAFAWSPSLNLVSTRRRPFYLTSILSRAETQPTAA
ncbi:MAG: class I SAM-dependent methyltransferase [Acetobacteraceae bacterium]|nr:class I SAM-dependent methyltransferase [Acetobacteraceae bacterium]